MKIDQSEFRVYQRVEAVQKPIPMLFRYVVPNIIVITALLWGGFYLAAQTIVSVWP